MQRRNRDIAAMGQLRAVAGGQGADVAAELVYGCLVVVVRRSEQPEAFITPIEGEYRDPTDLAEEILGPQAHTSGQAQYTVFQSAAQAS